MENSLTQKSFTPRKRHNPDNMSPKDWAEIVIDFLAYCKPTILSRNDSWDSFKSSKNDAFQEKFRSFNSLDNVLTYSQNNLRQAIKWELIQFSKEINVNKIKVFCLAWYNRSITGGATSIIVLTEDIRLLICEISFSEEPDIQREGKDEVHYTEKGAIFFANDSNLELFLQKTNNTGQSLLKAIYQFTLDTIRFHKANSAEEEINILSKIFHENVLSKMAVS